MRFRSLLIWAFGVWFFGSCLSPAQARPAQVLLMRHGHKGENRSITNLSPVGFQRAIALAAALPSCFGRVDHILVYTLDSTNGKNARSYQTAVPLAVATGSTIQILELAEQRSQRLGEDILRDPRYDDAHLVVFWEHRHLPELASGLGWSSMPPIADSDFDRLYQLRFASRSSRPVVTSYDQRRLLDGSQPCLAPDQPLTPLP